MAICLQISWDRFMLYQNLKPIRISARTIDFLRSGLEPNRFKLLILVLQFTDTMKINGDKSLCYMVWKCRRMETVMEESGRK